MTDHAELGEFYRRYGESSFREDEPLYADICQGIADRPELLALLAAHPREQQQPNLILAAVHYLLLRGLDHELGGIYAGGRGDVAAAFADLVLTHRAEVDLLLDTRRTQTNEVGRSAVLAVLLNHAQRSQDKPIGWIDLGTSAGLNLALDRYRIEYSIDGRTTTTGPGDAPLVLTSEVRHGAPPVARDHASIEWRLGVDRAPLDVTNPDQARWLHACLWPSNTDRIARLHAAIAVARDRRPEIVTAEAVEGLASALRRMPEGLCPVVTTTWVWYYLPSDVQADTLAVMRGHHERIHWYSIEGSGVVAALGAPRDRHAVDSVIGLVRTGGGGVDETMTLGPSHPHGAWFSWSYRSGGDL